MKFYDIMYQTTNETKSLLKLMEELQDDITQKKKQSRRFYVLGCGGRHCIRIPKAYYKAHDACQTMGRPS